MPTAKKRQAPKLTKNQQELRALHKAGLWSGDYRTVKGEASGAQKRLRAKFKDVLPDLMAGKAKSVSVKGARKDAEFDTAKARDRVVVRVDSTKENVRYNPKTNTFTSITRDYGVTYRRIRFSKAPSSVAALPRGNNYRYLVPFAQWGLESPKWESPEELASFMAGYETRANGKPGFTNWLSYVEVLAPVRASRGGGANDE